MMRGDGDTIGTPALIAGMWCCQQHVPSLGLHKNRHEQSRGAYREAARSRELRVLQRSPRAEELGGRFDLPERAVLFFELVRLSAQRRVFVSCRNEK